MSCSRTLQAFVKAQEMKVLKANQETINKLIENAKLLLSQKLEKLNLIVKNMEVKYDYAKFYIKDKYNICHDFVNIAKAFNFSVSKENDTYILTDKILDILNSIKYSFSPIDCISNVTILPKNKNINITNNKQVIELINKKVSLKSNYSVEEKVLKEIFDFRNRNFSWNKTNKFSKVDKFINEFNQIIKEANNDLINGTTAVLKYRAKQLGYVVKETKTKDNVQLVLERID